MTLEILGDGTGVGKSRVLAGIIYENSKMGVKQFLWITANEGLFKSAQEEIKHFLPDAQFTNVKDLPNQSPSNSVEVLFITYRTLTVDTKYNSIKNWLGDSFEGLVTYK